MSETAAKAAAKDKRFGEITAGRVAAHYVPPYATMLEKVSADHVAGIILVEELANEGVLPIQLAQLIELDCKNQRMRILQTTTYSKEGKPGTTDTRLGEWTYNQPQTVAKGFETLICDSRLTAPDNTPMQPSQPLK